MSHSNTARLYSQWNRIAIYSAANHWTELRDANCRLFMTSSFPSSMILDVRRCNVVFVRNKHTKIHVNVCFTVNLFAGVLQYNGGKSKESEGYNCFFIVSCVLESKYIPALAVNCCRSVVSRYIYFTLVYSLLYN